MKSISPEGLSIIRTTIDNMDKVVNTLAYVRDDNETEHQIKALVAISINQIIRDADTLSTLFGYKNAENK